MELICILTYDFYSLPGAYHLRIGKENEDRVHVLQANGTTAAVVCDGAGSTRFGAAAAEETSRVLADLLIRQFDALYLDDCNTAQQQAVCAVEYALQNLSRSQNIPTQDLACTILAAAVAEDGRCICFHLGDGIILQKNREDRRFSVVSAPMNGLAPHSTYLTMNCNMTRYLRCYRWQTPELSHLLLLTDGAAEHLVRPAGGRGWVYTKNTDLEFCDICSHLSCQLPADDCTIARISRTPLQNSGT